MANVLQQLFGNKTPSWAREKIEAAIQKHSLSLDLNGFEKENVLMKIPKSVFEMT